MNKFQQAIKFTHSLRFAFTNQRKTRSEEHQTKMDLPLPKIKEQKRYPMCQNAFNSSQKQMLLLENLNCQGKQFIKLHDQIQRKLRELQRDGRQTAKRYGKLIYQSVFPYCLSLYFFILGTSKTYREIYGPLVLDYLTPLPLIGFYFNKISSRIKENLKEKQKRVIKINKVLGHFDRRGTLYMIRNLKAILLFLSEENLQMIEESFNRSFFLPKIFRKDSFIVNYYYCFRDQQRMFLAIMKTQIITDNIYEQAAESVLKAKKQKNNIKS